MAGHTEGPWQSQHDFDRDGELTIIGAIDGPDGGHTDFHYTTVCIVEEGEEATANARLIASLPDLVEALREWKCPSCGGCGKYQPTGNHPGTPKIDCKVCETTGLHPVARAALAKAGVAT